MNAKSRCDLTRNSRKKKEVDRQAATIAGALPQGIAKPALRALYAVGVRSLSDLRGLSAAEFSALHGIGPNAMRVLRSAMAEQGIRFRED